MTADARPLLGDPVDRVDGPLKVTGAASYPSDVSFPDLAHAALVQSAIAAGTIRRIDVAAAAAAPGVLAVLTHENAPPIGEGPTMAFDGTPRFPLKDNRILHHGQHVAIVVAETRLQAIAAAGLVTIDYEATAPVLGIENPDAEVYRNPWGLETRRGDVATALAAAAVTYDETFATSAETNSPIGLFTTVARWEGGKLSVHDSSQWPMMVRQTLAIAFGIPESDVRVLVPFLGGGFGAGLKAWPHMILTALAARVVNRPVKLVLTRPQMFTSVGHRPQTLQRVRLGATREGRLLAIDQEATWTRGIEDTDIEPITVCTGAAYACPNVATHDRQVALNIPSPCAMRAPGAVEGNFALESALDELSYTLGIDPIALRLLNYAEVDPKSGLPWSSKAQRECYRAGAERFGWTARNPRIASMRAGDWRVGYGMAGANYEWYTQSCQARISISREGRALVRSAGTDIGTGTYTVAAQLAAQLLGLDIGSIRVELGDSDLPPAPQSGGSGLAIAISGAIEAAAANLLRAFLDVVADDDRSPLGGRGPDEIAVASGRIQLAGDPAVGETYGEILERHGLDELTAGGEFAPQPEGKGMAPSSAFSAVFAEVRIDPDLGLLRIARIVSAVDAGRILNQKLARSQIMGAVVMGIGMALFEETLFDSGGRIANATFADYLVPVNADIPDLDVVFVGEPDRFNPNGIKGLGEIGLVAVPAAIANAVYHATGRRIRSLPITIENLL